MTTKRSFKSSHTRINSLSQASVLALKTGLVNWTACRLYTVELLPDVPLSETHWHFQSLESRLKGSQWKSDTSDGGELGLVRFAEDRNSVLGVQDMQNERTQPATAFDSSCANILEKQSRFRRTVSFGSIERAAEPTRRRIWKYQISRARKAFEAVSLEDSHAAQRV